MIMLATAFAASADNENTDKVQTYIYDTPYDVQSIVLPTHGKVKNVILMIGDGMSLCHVQSAWTTNRGKLFMTNANATGLAITPCVNRLITDSGAGGTALATGHFTNYHSVGVDAEGRPLKSLIDYAKEKGLGTGLAVTCRLWDATPADFCCHIVDRDQEDEVVTGYVNCNADYVCGGGLEKFENRKDGRNLLKELEKKGYAIARSWEECKNLKADKIFAVTDPKDTPLPKERGDRLAQSALKGMNMLAEKNKDKGFFFMIEGSQLDDYGHFNEIGLLMEETLDFDQTLGRVLEWAAKDGETLVVVTADHETGGLTLIGGDLAKGEIKVKFSTGDHSGTMVPVYAFGPGAENFTGMYKQTDVCEKIKKLLNL